MGQVVTQIRPWSTGTVKKYYHWPKNLASSTSSAESCFLNEQLFTILWSKLDNFFYVFDAKLSKTYHLNHLIDMDFGYIETCPKTGIFDICSSSAFKSKFIDINNQLLLNYSPFEWDWPTGTMAHLLQCFNLWTSAAWS